MILTFCIFTLFSFLPLNPKVMFGRFVFPALHNLAIFAIPIVPTILVIGVGCEEVVGGSGGRHTFGSSLFRGVGAVLVRNEVSLQEIGQNEK